MGGLNRRLTQLEARIVSSPPHDDTRQAVLSSLSVEELRAYVGALRRMRDGEEPVVEDGAILARVKELYEEVRNEHG